MAQSAVSTAIAALEERHNTKLFHRVGRGITLTEAGVIFLEEAKAVLARAEAAELVLAELSGLKKGSLNVFASQTIASYWLPRYLVDFHMAFPDIDVRLSVGNTTEVVRAINDGAVDFGFVEGNVNDNSLVVEAIARDQMVIVVGLDHPWAKATSISPSQWPESQWVMREVGSGTRSMFENAARSAGVFEKLLIAIDLPTNEGVRGAVEAGLGASAISASVAAPSIEAGLLVHVPSSLPERAFTYIRHAERYKSGAEDALLKIIRGR